MTKIYKNAVVVIMRFFSYLLFLLIVLSCSGMSKKPSPEERPKPEFPDTELKQIIIRGSYHPENPERVKEVEKALREEGFLKEGETLKERSPSMLDWGDERYIYTNKKYCYNTVKTANRERCYKYNFRVRLYDKEGEMIAEDCLRLEYPYRYDEDGRYSEEFLKSANPPDAPEPIEYRTKAEDGILEGRATLAYIPYDENSYETRIVRLEGKKEIVLESFSGGGPPRKSVLIEYYQPIARYRGHGYEYNEEIQCHISPGPK